ncbi:Gti1/Pac2 family-domain-containing protein [Mycena metata]|uniref:Gti1/Pac2 family-domain-containing protein n=1 Tax=Mycena metata TaxID=1033252 RepID=A0AAD7K6B7_9AGAR|nr:Gti1/Pac2 family-domain-containing protein [Mycena metata]
MPHTEYPYVTHPALYIRDTSDSHRVLEAVRLGILPVIKRRLTPDQRAELRAGNVFVWEESEHDSGFVRWTDGRRWSQSKMRGDCLYYEEKIEITDAERRARATRRALKASDSFFPIPVAPRRQDRPSKVGGLTKQTYSLMINVPGVAKAKKWHLVAYFSPRDVTHLPTVDDYDYLRNIPIPKSVFPGNPDSGTVNSLWPLEMPASPGPTPSLSPVMLAPELESAYSISRSTPLDAFPIALPPITSARLPTKSSKLPALSSLGSAMPRALGRRKGSPVTSMAGRYTYCPDDRRMLQRLRVRI